MRTPTIIVAAAMLASLALTACNKSSPPPQEPVKPRGVAAIEAPLPLPAP